MGRSGGSRPYHRKRSSCHSYAPSSVPFNLDGCTVRQELVFVARYSHCAPWNASPEMVAIRASSARWALCFLTAVRPSWMQAKLSAVRKSTWPLSAATRCPLMTQESVQFSGDVSVRSVRASSECFVDRRVPPLPGSPSPNPLNRSGKKVSRSVFLTGPKASTMPRLTRYTNAHSY